MVERCPAQGGKGWATAILAALLALVTIGVSAANARSTGSRPSGDCPGQALALPPEAVARAADAALREAPRLYGKDTAKDARVTSSQRADTGLGRGDEVKSQCGVKVQQRTVVVDLQFPRLLPSASLSQGTVFVSRFGDGYQVWKVAR